MKKYSNNYEGIDQKIVTQVSYQASKLMRQLSVRASMERADLEQEFMLAILESMDAYDREKGRLSTFVSYVLSNKAKNIIEKLQTEKRGRGMCVSEWANEVYYDPTNSICLSVDLDKVSRCMPEPLASLLVHLRVHNVYETSGLTNVPHSTLYLWLKRLRAYLRKRGFYSYL